MIAIANATIDIFYPSNFEMLANLAKASEPD